MQTTETKGLTSRERCLLEALRIARGALKVSRAYMAYYDRPTRKHDEAIHAADAAILKATGGA